MNIQPLTRQLSLDAEPLEQIQATDILDDAFMWAMGQFANWVVDTVLMS